MMDIETSVQFYSESKILHRARMHRGIWDQQPTYYLSVEPEYQDGSQFNVIVCDLQDDREEGAYSDAQKLYHFASTQSIPANSAIVLTTADEYTAMVYDLVAGWIKEKTNGIYTVKEGMLGRVFLVTTGVEV